MQRANATSADVQADHVPVARSVHPVSNDRNISEGYPGNQAMLRRLSSATPRLQCKLTIGAVDDPLEAEADHMADQVMRMTDPNLSISSAELKISRKCAACEDEDKDMKLHAKSDGALAHGEAPPIVQDVLSSTGQPLAPATRAFMEPRFGHDFSDVRIYSDQKAAQSARSISALAYATGSNIAFGAGQYQPHTESGQRLLAHELTHVLQQDGAPTLRRACGPDAIGKPAGCEAGAAAFADGPTFRFTVNCDEWADGADAGLLDFIQSVPATSNIQIDAYASTDGPEGFNTNLACARALKAKSLLLAAGIAPARITKMVDHGATPGKADDRRSVVITALGAPATPDPAQTPPANPPATAPPVRPGPLADPPQTQTPAVPATNPGGPCAAPAKVATRLDVTQALTDFLNKAQTAQGTQAVRLTDTVKWAIRKLFNGDPIGSINAEGLLSRPDVPGQPADLAAAVTKFLPDTIPCSRMAHLATQSPADIPDKSPKSFGDAVGKLITDTVVEPLVRKLPIKKDLQDTIIDGVRSATADLLVAVADAAMSNAQVSDQDKAAIHSAIEAAIKQPVKPATDPHKDPAGDPNNPPQPPPAPSLNAPQEPGEHDIKSPQIPAPLPPAPDAPKPNVPQPPKAGDAQTVDQVIQGIDDKSLIPAAAKGTEQEGEFAGAQDLARSIANQLGDANKKKQFTVNVTIGMNYRRVADLADIFDKIEAIIRQIAKAIPGGVPNVGQVIVTPATAKDDTTLPARRIVRLQGG